MEVKRIDIYDFKVVFAHKEFMKLKAIAENFHTEVGIMIEVLLVKAIHERFNSLE